ncbi:MAG: sigma-70 family RNA polymerase sigma factor, partial [Candidatus Woesearchaeota archaeon]|nr:sigma-70 family RNA polymerase sigma factor [Candidatus Woesearchaeota archaeon]
SRLAKAKKMLKQLNTDKNSLATPHLLWGFYLANKYSSFAPKEALQHTAYLGLLKAAENYDSTRGRFTTYATAWIISSLQNAVRTHCKPDMTPSEFRIYLKLQKAESFLFQEKHRKPNTQELADYLKISLKRVEQARTQDVKLRYAVDEAEWSDIAEEIPNCPVENAHQRDLVREIRNHIDKLNPREQEVIRKLYGIDETIHTLDEIGKRLGLTRERVRQIEAKALPKLQRRDLEKYLEKEEKTAD